MKMAWARRARESARAGSATGSPSSQISSVPVGSSTSKRATMRSSPTGASSR